MREQIAATNALITFRKTHGMSVPKELLRIKTAFENEEASEGCRLAFGVKPFGMGSLTDEYPEPMPDEDRTYCQVVHESLVRNWCFWINVAYDEDNTYWKRVIRAVGSIADHGRTQR